MRKKLFSKNSSFFEDIGNSRYFVFLCFFCSCLIFVNYMNCDLCQNSIGIINLQQLISFSKDFRFLINMYIFFNFSLAPNEKNFSSLGFTGDYHS